MTDQMETIKVLQLASFSGNIGDNANITGTRKLLRRNLDFELDFTNLEIRESFWGNLKFDESFADYVNTFDLFIFGGGNFFELWVDKSSNNTSVDIDLPIMEKIKTPTVFYSLGMDPGMGVSDKGINKFKRWLDYVISEDRFVLSLRNDGSMKTAETYLGDLYKSHFHFVPDGGFFTDIEADYYPGYVEGQVNIGMNLAGDMLDVRFPEHKDDYISYSHFLKEMSQYFDELFRSNEKVQLIVFPHIYKDLNIASDLLHNIKDKHSRNRITVAPYLHGFAAQDYIFGQYSKCDLILGNRFHSNVCAIGLKVPTVGLINYRQIEDLYEELEMPSRAVKINKMGFASSLTSLVNSSIENRDLIANEYAELRGRLEQKTNEFHSYINEMLKNVKS
jgi:polysaccharide pyruvyl transferase WcaK-like protein